jgi:hypothetical protein
MAKQSIWAGSLESFHHRLVKPKEESRRTHEPNVFSIASATLLKTDADDTSSRYPGCDGKHQHHLKDCKKIQGFACGHSRELRLFEGLKSLPSLFRQ